MNEVNKLKVKRFQLKDEQVNMHMKIEKLKEESDIKEKLIKELSDEFERGSGIKDNANISRINSHDDSLSISEINTSYKT